MARLIVNPRTQKAYEIQLKPGENYLGRGFANDFKIEDPSVSGSHCQIMVSGARVSIKDLGSTNGTFVNRTPVKEATLQAGQILHLGGVELLLEADAAAIPVGPVTVSPAPVPAAARAIPVAVPAIPGKTEFIPAPIAAAAPQPAAFRAAVPVGAPAIPVAVPASAPAPVAVAPVAAPPPPPPPSGLRLSGPSATAPTASPPPAPVPVVPAAPAPQAMPAPQPAGAPLAVAPEGKTACKFHPNTAGKYLCPQCQNLFCSLCVASKRLTTGTSYFCRHCGVECAAVKVNFVPKQEKKNELAQYDDMTVLLRSLGFAFGASLISAGLWILMAWLLTFEVPFLWAIGVGALCGYAVKLGCQDRPGVVFSLIAVGFTILGIAIGKVVSFHFVLFPGLTAIIYMTIGSVVGLFLAWKFGGGDF